MNMRMLLPKGNNQ